MELEIAKKIANVDVIPKGWRLGLVGDDCKICNNLRKPINEADRDAMAGIYPYYGPTGILGYINEYRLDGEYALIGEDGDHFLKYDRQPMTLLINGKNNVNNHAHIIQGTDKCSAAWFYNYFKHKDLSNVLSRQGAGRYKLNKATLEKLPILLPPLQEQSEICKMTAVWDEIIIRLQNGIVTKREQKHALMQRMLTGKLRFQEFKGQQWKKRAFKEIFTPYKDVNSNNLDYEVLSVTINGIVSQSEYFNKEVASEDKSAYLIVKRDTLVMSGLNFWMGAIDFQKIRDIGIVSPAYKTFHVNKNSCDIVFLKHFVRSEIMRRVLIGASVQGASIVRRNLDGDMLMDSAISLPDIQEQQKIAAVLSAADCEIDQLTQKLDAYKQQKKGLMQQLLTGKKRVCIAKSEAA